MSEGSVPKRGLGNRRPIISDEIVDKICGAIREGLFDYQAAARAGIGRVTFDDWKRKARSAKSGPYKDLADRLEEARVFREGLWLGHIRDQMARDWRAASWALIVTNRQLYSPKQPETPSQEADPADALKQLVRAMERSARATLEAVGKAPEDFYAIQSDTSGGAA